MLVFQTLLVERHGLEELARTLRRKRRTRLQTLTSCSRRLGQSRRFVYNCCPTWIQNTDYLHQARTPSPHHGGAWIHKEVLECWVPGTSFITETTTQESEPHRDTRPSQPDTENLASHTHLTHHPIHLLSSIFVCPYIWCPITC